MEYNLCKKSLNAAFPLLDTVGEQPVDADITLPDYCPDVERILRCSLIPRIYLSNVSGDRLAVEGAACIRVLYLDSEHCCVRAFEHTVPFSESFALKDSPADCAVYTDAKPEYLNCRALSPRKLSLHGAFSLYARVIVQRPIEYRAYEEDDDLQVNAETLSVSELSGLCRDVFSVQEDIPLSGQPGIASVLSHRLSVRITELKAIRGKLMLTAEGRLELMYMSSLDSGEPECMTHAFAFSRVVDCAGADEDSVIQASLDLMTYDLSLSDDALGGAGVIALDMKLCLNALCYSDGEISVIGDVFSTEREVEPRYEPFGCVGSVRRLTFTDIAKATVTLEGDTIGKVLDIHPVRIAVSAAISGGAPLLSSKLTVGMMYVGSEGDIRCIERDVEFGYNPSADDLDSVDAVSADVCSLSYRIVDASTIELRAEVCYHMTVSKRISRPAVAAVSADDDAPAYSDDDALILYYADGGERIWDIAKRYHTRPACIMSENGLEDGVLDEDMMLMIP